MKTSKPILLLTLAVVLLAGICHSQGSPSGPKLVAEQYPRSVAEPVPAGGHPWSQVPVATRLRRFFTKDESEKVEAYYTKKYGPFEDHYRPMMATTEIEAILAQHGIRYGGETGGDEVGGVGAGVTVIGREANSSNAAHQALDRLTRAYLARFINDEDPNPAKHMEDPELKQTLARYESLETAHYVTTTVKDTATQRNLTMDEVLFDKYFDAPGRAMLKEQEELREKLTAATMSKKYDEAGRLGNKLVELVQRQSNTSWQWDVAIKCLDEMTANAYATIVVIDVHPSQWDLSPIQK